MNDSEQQADAAQSVDKWAAGANLDVVSVDVPDANHVEVVVVGHSQPPNVEPLATGISEDFGRDVKVSVSWIKRRMFDAQGATS